jgi:hypothetical protein
MTRGSILEYTEAVLSIVFGLFKFLAISKPLKLSNHLERVAGDDTGGVKLHSAEIRGTNPGIASGLLLFF